MNISYLFFQGICRQLRTHQTHIWRPITFDPETFAVCLKIFFFVEYLPTASTSRSIDVIRQKKERGKNYRLNQIIRTNEAIKKKQNLFDDDFDLTKPYR